MATQPPVLLIVPGSFAPVSLYEPFHRLLTTQGIAAHIVPTASVGRRPAPHAPATMSDDVDAIARVAERVFAEDKRDVVLLAHSYGGIPATECLKLLSKKNRGEGEYSVVGVAYLAAIVLQVGQSSWSMQGGRFPPWLDVQDDYMTITDTTISGPATFSDLPPEEAIKLAVNMTTHATPSFKEPLTYDGYSDVAVDYIYLTQDKIVLPEAQKGLIALLEQASGRAPTVHEIASDHAPIASHPQELLEVVKTILARHAK